MTPTFPLTELLQQSLSEELHPHQHPAVEQQLAQAVQSAHATWPTIGLSDSTFLVHVAEKLDPTLPCPSALEELHLEELYLAAACLHQNAQALDIFAAQYMAPLQIRLHSLPNLDQLTAEMRQHVWTLLFEHTPSKTPKIAQYAGTGTLRSWLQTVVTREALGMLRKHKREQALDEEVIFQLTAQPHDAADQEFLYFRKLYRDAFKQAFQDALTALAPRERTLLKYHTLDGLNIEQIGQIYRVHRATAARWLARIRQQLMDSTCALMKQRLGLSEEETQSLLRMIQSQLDLSLIRLLDPSRKEK